MGLKKKVKKEGAQSVILEKILYICGDNLILIGFIDIWKKRQ
jgi:hypothetical protein